MVDMLILKKSTCHLRPDTSQGIAGIVVKLKNMDKFYCNKKYIRSYSDK